MTAMSEIPLPRAAKRVAPWWLVRHETMLAAILLVALVVLGALNNRFLTVDNLLNQGRLMTEVGLIALPMTFIIITGGIDLSVGSTVGLCAILLGYSWKTFDFPLPLAIVFSLLVGAFAGFFNGLVITRLKVPPLIMTIATLALYRGLAEGISQAHSVRGYPDWFYFTGQSNLFGVPAQLWLLVIAIVIAGVALDRTTFGRTLYAIGNNETAARFSGLAVDRVKLIIYTLSGFMAGLSGYVLVSRVTTTRSDMGIGYELDVIAAVVLGGTSLTGGRGTIVGTALGTMTIAVISNGLILAHINPFFTQIVTGAIILTALWLNTRIFDRLRAGERRS
jgi:rhamnose transport system permease protein